MTWSEEAFQQSVIGLKKSLDKAVEISLAERGYGKMEKIKLTQEQADLIEEIKSWQSEEHQSINYLSAEDLAKCILAPDSYEVIPQIKVGDWTTYDNGPYANPRYATRQVVDFDEDLVYFDEDRCMPVSAVRKATAEEESDAKKRQFWDGLGREVDEWKDGDIVTHNGYFTNISVLDIQQGVARFPTYSDDGERIVPIQTVCLATPVEQRLDK